MVPTTCRNMGPRLEAGSLARWILGRPRNAWVIGLRWYMARVVIHTSMPKRAIDLVPGLVLQVVLGQFPGEAEVAADGLAYPAAVQGTG